MSWKLLYMRQKSKCARLKNRLKREELQVEHYKNRSDQLYESYMDALDEITRLNENVTRLTCECCGAEIELAGRNKVVRYCPSCGNRVWAVKPVEVPVMIAFKAGRG